MAKIKWIHFSDLHLNQRGTETRRLRKKLITYLKKLNIICDYAFCTGDIRHAPSGDFPKNASKEIEEICEVVHLPDKRLFIVPGNHDINRDMTDRIKTINKVIDGSKTQESYDPKDGNISKYDLINISKGKEDFFDFLNTFSDKNIDVSKAQDAVKPHYVIETEEFNIIHVDSTLFYTFSRQKDFILGTYLLLEILEQLNTDKITILLTHYSFDFFERNEQKELIALFNDYNVRLWLAGHEHDHLARMQWDCFYEFQCGNLLLENGATACILLGEIDTDTGEGRVQVHAWYTQGDWDLYPFISRKDTDKSVYTFNVNRFKTKDGLESKATSEKEQRKKLHLQIFSMLEENRTIFETYGPVSANRSNIASEYADNWHIQINKVILPNSKRIISLLEDNIGVLNFDEQKVLYKYKQHIDGLEKNHLIKGEFLMDAPRFPKEIYDILKSED